MNQEALWPNSHSAAGKARAVASFNRYRQLIMRKWWLLSSGLMAGLIVASCVWWLQPARFLSIGRMIVSIKLALPEGSVYSEELANFLGTQTALMQSRVVRDRAEARLAQTNPTFVSQALNLRVTVSPKTSIFVLEASGNDPNSVQAFLAAIMHQYIELKKEMRAQASDTTIAGLTEQLLRLEKELRAAQDQLTRFQTSNSVALLEEQGNIALNYLGALHQRLAAARADYALLRGLSVSGEKALVCGGATNDIQGEHGSESPWLWDQTDGCNTELLKARQQLVLLEAEERDLGQYLRPKHPKMVALSEEKARCARLLQILSRQKTAQLESRRASLGQQIGGLQEEIDAWNRKSMESSRQSIEYQRLRGSEQRVRSLYDRLLATLQALDVNKEISPESVTILEPASPAFSDLRKPAMQLITGLVVGLLASLGLVLLIDHVDDRLNSHTEVQQWFEEPVLVQIPRQTQNGRKSKMPLLELNDSRHAFAEAYRGLRSSLLYLAREKHCPKTLLLTSSIPGEGKSTTSANLAITLGQAGARVLLVDADLRKGDLHTRLGLPLGPGLAEIFEHRCRWQDAVRPTGYSNLALLGRGDACHASSDLFVRQPIRDFLKEISAGYDYVILDAPPVMAADDVASLAPQADAVLFVLRAEFTSARMAWASLDVLYRRQVHVLGIVFNAVRANNPDHYSYERYTKYFQGAHRRPNLMPAPGRKT